MSQQAPPPRPSDPISTYFRVSRGAWYGFLFALPVLLGYELLEWLFGSRVINGADAIVRAMLALLGPRERSVTMLVLVAVAGLLCWLFDGSRKATQLHEFRPRYFLWMFTESLIYAISLGPAINHILGLLSGGVGLQMGGGGGGPIFALTMSLGAGIYEELVFRVLLLGGLVLLLESVFKMDGLLAWVVGVVISSVIFSLFHYAPFGMEPFEFGSFIFRFVAGGLLATLYAARGFGIAVWSHALYDVLVFALSG
ncbi:MAG: CPBP family intramembrane metalloprotease [Armatimonadetes bacterium]|nr:CPBP family intramembrane metalloprotease [Armatimonadota bacterium]